MSNSADDLLSFKEFPPVHGNQGNSPPTAQISINSPQRMFVSGDPPKDPLTDLINDMSASVRAMNEQETPNQAPPNVEEGSDKKMYSFWSIEYYQQFFNVDTLMVVDRIASSMIPRRAPTNYLKSHIGLNPDLYGPFWIMVTLIFSIAISGNISNYLQYAKEDFTWKYNFHLVSYAATAIFVYACFIPATLWAILKWSTNPVDPDLEEESSIYTPGLLSLMCVYGYSLAIYIPVSILWVIQVSFLQWLLVITAALLSGSVLIFVLTPALRNSKFSLFLIIGILGAHFLLAAGFMLYFFHVPNSASTPESVQAHVDVVKKIITPIANATNNNKV